MMGLVNTIRWETCDRWKCGRNRGGSDSWFLRTVVKSGEESTTEVKLNLTADLSRSVWGSGEGEQHFAGAKAKRLVYVKSWKEDKWLGVKWSGVRCCVRQKGQEDSHTPYSAVSTWFSYLTGILMRSWFHKVYFEQVLVGHFLDAVYQVLVGPLLDAGFFVCFYRSKLSCWKEIKSQKGSGTE